MVAFDPEIASVTVGPPAMTLPSVSRRVTDTTDPSAASVEAEMEIGLRVRRLLPGLTVPATKVSVPVFVTATPSM